MIAYLLKRVGSTVAIMLIVSLLVFLLLHLAPGDPAQVLAGDNATAEQIARLRQTLGLGAGSTRIDLIGAALLQSALADFPATGIVMHPSDWVRISLLKDADGRYLVGSALDMVQPRLFGLPVVATKGMNAGEFLVGDFARAATIFDRWQPRVEVGFVGEDFTRNMLTILDESRIALAVKQPLALTYGSFE